MPSGVERWLSAAPHVVLELAPGVDEALLFRQELAPELPGFEHPERQ